MPQPRSHDRAAAVALPTISIKYGCVPGTTLRPGPGGVRIRLAMHIYDGAATGSLSMSGHADVGKPVHIRQWRSGLLNKLKKDL
jgi:hypothetical protein